MVNEIQAVLDYIRKRPQSTAASIGSALNIPRRTLFRYLKELVKERKISKIGQAPHLTYALPGVVQETKTTKVTDPPLVSFQVTNPVTYLKLWWKKIMANEGVDLRLRIRPLTALAMILLLGGGSFALGRITLPASSPIVKYVPQLLPSPSPNPWRDAAYTGTLRQSGTRFYLTTAEAEAITLEAPANVNLSKLLNRRILAVGKYNSLTKILQVTDAADLEVLPTTAVPVPTTTPSPSPDSS